MTMHTDGCLVNNRKPKQSGNCREDEGKSSCVLKKNCYYCESNNKCYNYKDIGTSQLKNICADSGIETCLYKRRYPY